MNLKTTKDRATGAIVIHAGKQAINTGLTNQAEVGRLIKAAAHMPGLASIHLGKHVTNTEALAAWAQWLGTARSDVTARNCLTWLKAFLDAQRLREKSPAQIEPAHIDRWINNPKATTKASTRRIMLSVLKGFFQYCLIENFALRDPTRGCHVKYKLLTHDQKESKPKTIFTLAEYRAILGHLAKQTAALQDKLTHLERMDDQGKLTTQGRAKIKDLRLQGQWSQFWRAATVIARNTGLRLGDVAQIEPAVFKDPGYIIVWTDKYNARVKLRIDKFILDPAEFRATVKTLDLTESYCFPLQRAINIDPQRCNILNMRYKRLLTAAGIPEGKTFHSHRHTFVDECRRRGIPTPHISQAVGHASLKMTERYMHYEND